MSRGGRGGFRGGGAAGGGNQLLPFEVDPALESEIAAYREKEALDEADEWMKQLYPNMKVYPQPPPTAYEKRLVQKRREFRSAMRNGPFFIDAPRTGKRDLAAFNPFEDQTTFGNKRAKRQGGLPNLKRLPIVKELLPQELWDLVDNGEDEGADGKTTRKDLDWLKRKRIDKLKQFDEGAEVDAAPPADDDDDEGPKNELNEGEEDIEDPQDDDFSEDDDDAGNDYNAEKYFDDGEGDGDDGGGDGDGEDAW